MLARRSLIGLLMASMVSTSLNAVQPPTTIAENSSTSGNFATDRLVAWCIVPFDAEQRTPEQRAEMLRELGLRRLAYDWRPEHVSSFEDEVIACQTHGIEFFAFWNWHDALIPLVKRYGIRPQIWVTCPSPAGETQSARVVAAADELDPLVKQAANLKLEIGLYNHGGWGGEPANLVAVCEQLRRRHAAAKVGIVYNFHHGHGHVDEFGSSLSVMMPYLICLNLNGMIDLSADDEADQAKKIRPIGSGRYETEMIRQVLASGYSGPIGILDHRNDLDAKRSLQANIEGLADVLNELQ